MTKGMVCIECPKGCVLSVEIENNKAVKVTGAGCPKGIMYASAEIDCPVRIFTSTVMTEGLSMKTAPVRTDRPIPKKDLFRAVEETRRMKVGSSLNSGDVIAEDFLGLGVRLVATRQVY